MGLEDVALLSATHHSAPSLHFELHSVEGGLQEMDGAVVGIDDELAIGPLGVLVAPIKSSSANCSSTSS